MPTQAKHATHTAAQTSAQESPEMLEAVTSLYAQGIDRLAEVQKKGLDLATKQNNEIIQSWKKISLAIPGAPGMMMLELASSAFDRYADTQKGAIDLVLTQSHALLDVVKDGTGTALESNAISADLIQQAVEQSVSAQKKALDHSATKTKAAFQKVKSEMGLSGTSAELAADTLQLGVEHMIASQKELLDFAARPLRTGKAGAHAKA